MNPMVTTKVCNRCRKKKKERNPSVTLKKAVESHRNKLTQERNRELQIQPKKKKKHKMQISTYLLIITLNANGLSAPNKRHRVSEWI